LRKSKLKLPYRVGLTKKAYEQLKELKRKRKKSMAQIVCDLIKEEHDLFT